MGCCGSKKKQEEEERKRRTRQQERERERQPIVAAKKVPTDTSHSSSSASSSNSAATIESTPKCERGANVPKTKLPSAHSSELACQNLRTQSIAADSVTSMGDIMAGLTTSTIAVLNAELKSTMDNVSKTEKLKSMLPAAKTVRPDSGHSAKFGHGSASLSYSSQQSEDDVPKDTRGTSSREKSVSLSDKSGDKSVISKPSNHSHGESPSGQKEHQVLGRQELPLRPLTGDPKTESATKGAVAGTVQLGTTAQETSIKSYKSIRSNPTGPQENGHKVDQDSMQIYQTVGSHSSNSSKNGPQGGNIPEPKKS